VDKVEKLWCYKIEIEKDNPPSSKSLRFPKLQIIRRDILHKVTEAIMEPNDIGVPPWCTDIAAGYLGD